MAAEIFVAVGDAPIDAGAESARLAASCAGIAGASAYFVGTVRDDGEVRAMTLEHYPGMTEAALRQIAENAAVKWPLLAARIIHRIGRMIPGDAIVFVGAASAHRGDAFRACEFMTDYLKTRAPFWKKEEITGGKTRWVQARAADDAAMQKWK